MSNGDRMSWARRCLELVAIVCVSPDAVPLAAQGSAGTPAASADSVVVTAGPGYRASWLHEVFFGRHHRVLWTTPIQVELLDLSNVGGGLVPVRRGGGGQTASLHFAGKDGREYVFRSVNKTPAWLPPDLRETIAERILQDQISVLHPGAALIAAPLLEAAGVLHAEPRLMVMPDDPRLGEYRAEFGRMLGILEEYPTEGASGEPGFAGSRDIVGTDKLLERLEHSARTRPDSRAYLAARLMDLLFADGDRHAGQWRWARSPAGDHAVWRPISRDRDEAFARFDGVFPRLAGVSNRDLVGFGPDYGSIYGLTWRAQDLDRRLLADLEKPVWDSTALALQARLTDSAIAAAVRRLPPEYYRVDGAALARDLERRRDQLPAAATRFYALLAHDVDIHATDESEVAEVEREADGRVKVRLLLRDAGASLAPYFERTFRRAETQEIRLFLHGGDDRVMVRGAAERSLLVRVIGGGGRDELIDSSRVAQGGRLTRFYDLRPGDEVTAGPGTLVDRRPYRQPPPTDRFHKQPRDWGHDWAPFPWASFQPDVGLIAAGGVTFTSYGFRHHPYRSRLSVRLGYATGAQRFGVDLKGDFRGARRSSLRVRWSGFEVVRFYGIGNETPVVGPSDFYRVRQQQYLVAPALIVPLSAAVEVSIGPQLKYALTDLVAGTFIELTRPYGTESFGQVGAQAGLRIDTRDQRVAATRGVLLTAGGSAYPKLWDVTAAFGEGHAEATTYLTASLPLRPTLGLRAGGKKVWGRFPFHEAAFIGGASTVRGFSEHRFAGSGAVYGNVELRLKVARFSVALPADWGVFGLLDGGRVYVAGETSDRWHAAAGGGIWCAFLNNRNTVSVSIARSTERTAAYVRGGFAF